MRLRPKHIALLLILLVLALPVISFFLLPWKLALAQRLEAIMEKKGFHHVSLTVSALGWHGATLKDVSIGDANPLTLKSVELHYEPQELRTGTLRDLTVGGLALAAHHEDGGWMVAGLEDYMKGASDGAPFAFPVSAEDLKRFPFNTLKIEDSALSLISGSLRLDMPLAVEFQKSPGGKLTYSGASLSFHMSNFEMDTGAASVSLALKEQEKHWDGPWSVKGVTLKNNSTLPVMDAGGTLTMTANQVAVRGTLVSKDKNYNVAFTLDEYLSEPGKSLLTVTSASMPWNHGALSVRNLKIPLNSTAPVTILVNVSGVSVDDLMQSLTGKRVTATGTVSGSIPVVIGRDGSFSLSDGSLKASGPGQIALPPDVIPGDNAQIALVRELLKDLHYTDLQVAIGNKGGNGENNKLTVTMTVEGNNPAVYNGRPVKLNVHLGGDVLDLVRQNVILLTDPKQMLNQGK